MKILFLDVDGVLNHSETFHKGEYFPIDPYCAFLVGKIQLDTDCVVVLSSSWRKMPDARADLEKRVVPIYDITGTCCSGIRGVEINNWINKNVSFEGRKQGTFRYAILDDDDDMLLWQKDNFFQTNFNEGGLTEEIAMRVIAHLNR